MKTLSDRLRDAAKTFMPSQTGHLLLEAAATIDRATTHDRMNQAPISWKRKLQISVSTGVPMRDRGRDWSVEECRAELERLHQRGE